MRRIDALREIGRLPALRVCNLGYPSRELYQVADDPANFYMLGSMGLASSIGLGLSLATSRRVVAIDGDGSVLMNLGSLSTIAHFAPGGFTLAILDNRTHGSTGDQPTHTALGTDLAKVASACGFSRVRTVESADQLRSALEEPGPSLIVVRIEPGNAEVPLIPLSGPEIRDRFREAAREK